jgi:hypothetical protein
MIEAGTTRLDGVAFRAVRTAGNHRRWGQILLGAALVFTALWGVWIFTSALRSGLHPSGLLLAIAVWFIVVAPLGISGRYRLEAARLEEKRYIHVAHGVLGLAGSLAGVCLVWLASAQVTPGGFVLGLLLRFVAVGPITYAGIRVLQLEKARG